MCIILLADCMVSPLRWSLPTYAKRHMHLCFFPLPPVSVPQILLTPHYWWWAVRFPLSLFASLSE